MTWHRRSNSASVTISVVHGDLPPGAALALHSDGLAETPEGNVDEDLPVCRNSPSPGHIGISKCTVATPGPCSLVARASNTSLATLRQKDCAPSTFTLVCR